METKIPYWQCLSGALAITAFGWLGGLVFMGVIALIVVIMKKVE